MRQCPLCSRQYEDGVRFCPHDGKGLPLPDTFVGKVIDGKYRIDALHGTGGMGAVYRATQVHLERTVAFKVVRGDFLKDNVTGQRFKREALAVARLKHPHIVTVYDFGITQDGGAYLVMEFLEGHSLRDELAKGKRLQLGRAIELMRQICSAVHAAHVEGIIHRDLKPENIFLETARDGSTVVKVLDFGVAKLRQASEMNAPELTMSGTLLGTPLYMAPEQCEGLSIDVRADIYSLGCVFYEMLAGRPPFIGNSGAAIIIKHASEKPKPPGAYGADVPSGVEATIMRSLAKAPEDRFQTAAELGQAFAAVWLPVDTMNPFPANAPGDQDGIIVVDEVDGLLGNLGAYDTPRDARKRLAVLPFRNVTRDQDIDFLGFALADAIITQLSGDKAIAVRPSSAIHGYADKSFETRDVAIALDVDLLVTGTFIKSGEAFQLTAQLVDVEVNEIVWQRRIRLKGDDILELQDTGAEEVLAGLRVNLGLGTEAVPLAQPAVTPRDVARPTKADTAQRNSAQAVVPTPMPVRDPAALDLVRQASELTDTQTGRSQAIDLLERSVELDPDNAEAWTALARRCYSQAVESFKGDGLALRGRAAAERAVALDPDQLGRDASLGMLLVEGGHTEDVAQRASQFLATRPDNVAARFALGYALRFGGLLDRSLREFRIAELRDGALVATQIAVINIQKGLYDDALRVLETVHAHSRRVPPLFLTAVAQGLKGDTRAARELSSEMAQIDANSVYTLMGQVLVSRLTTGRCAPALLGWLEDIKTEDGELHFWLAQIHAFAGDAEPAVARLRRAVEAGYFNAPYMQTDPLLEPIRETHDAASIIGIARMRHEQFARQ
jgi:serine/threonine protein kinase/tetratricopeptide (TPR) repeat protein